MAFGSLYPTLNHQSVEYDILLENVPPVLPQDEVQARIVEYFQHDDEEARGTNPATPSKLGLAGGHFDIQELIAQGFNVQARLFATMIAGASETVTLEVHGEVNDASVGLVPGLTVGTTSLTPVSLSSAWIPINAFYTTVIVPATGTIWEHDLYGFRTPAGVITPSPIYVNGASLWIRALK